MVREAGEALPTPRSKRQRNHEESAVLATPPLFFNGSVFKGGLQQHSLLQLRAHVVFIDFELIT
jgi:hypothetical protein